MLSHGRARIHNADFALVDRIAHAYKHVQTGNPADPNLQPLSAEGVVTRPPAYWAQPCGTIIMAIRLAVLRWTTSAPLPEAMGHYKRQARRYARDEVEQRPAVAGAKPGFADLQRTFKSFRSAWLRASTVGQRAFLKESCEDLSAIVDSAWQHSRGLNARSIFCRNSPRGWRSL